MEYAEADCVVKFQTGKFDCSDAGIIYWWITGADKGGNRSATPEEIKSLCQRRADPVTGVTKFDLNLLAPKIGPVRLYLSAPIRAFFSL